MLKKRPLLKEHDRYALKIASKFVSNAFPLTLTESAEQARLFKGGFLNSTSWDWQYGFEVLTEAQLKPLKSSKTRPETKGATKSLSTSQRRAIALLALFWGLSGATAGVPVTRIRGPVRITSTRALAPYVTQRAFNRPAVKFINTPLEPPRTSTVGLVARPIAYRPLKGAE